jgi:hypothetical protein
MNKTNKITHNFLFVKCNEDRTIDSISNWTGSKAFVNMIEIEERVNPVYIHKQR